MYWVAGDFVFVSLISGVWTLKLPDHLTARDTDGAQRMIRTYEESGSGWAVEGLRVTWPTSDCAQERTEMHAHHGLTWAEYEYDRMNRKLHRHRISLRAEPPGWTEEVDETVRLKNAGSKIHGSDISEAAYCTARLRLILDPVEAEGDSEPATYHPNRAGCGYQ